MQNLWFMKAYKKIQANFVSQSFHFHVALKVDVEVIQFKEIKSLKLWCPSSCGLKTLKSNILDFCLLTQQ